MRKKMILFICLMIVILVILLIWIIWILAQNQSPTPQTKSQTSQTMKKTYPQPEETKKTAVLQGKVTKIDQQTITIEQYPNKKDEGPKGHVKINKKTKIYLKQGQEWKPIVQDEIKQGMNASAWYDGVMIMMYPMQFSADVLVVEAK